MLLIMGPLIAACAKDAPPILGGERLSVLTFERQLEVDTEVQNIAVKIPRPFANPDWPQAGGYSHHAMHHLALGGNLSVAWTESVGSGTNSDSHLLAPPVIADGRVFTMDSIGRISAFGVRRGGRLWRVQPRLEDENEADGFGGGLAYEDGVLYITNGFGLAVAINASTGREIWRYNFSVPVRSAPTVSQGRLFVITTTNQLVVLDITDGHFLWAFDGLTEDATLLGGASPAVAGDLVISAFSSGELAALRVENGHVVWVDVLVKTGGLSSISSLNDIYGHPIADRDLIIAISHGGILTAVDKSTGERVWEREVEGISTPWVAGRFIYFLTTSAELVCILREDGRVRWIHELQPFENMRDNEDPIRWNGPVLAGNRLIVTSSHGWAYTISPYDGGLIGRTQLQQDIFLPPVVAAETVFVLTDAAELIAIR